MRKVSIEYKCDVCGRVCDKWSLFRVVDDRGRKLCDCFCLNRYEIPVDFEEYMLKCVCDDCIKKLRKCVDKVREDLYMGRE